MMYRESKFNIYTQSPDGACKLAFNSMSCALAEVDETYTELQRLIARNELDVSMLNGSMKDTFDAALSARFFVPDDKDENSEFLDLRNRQKYRTDILGLTIAPTLACNFRCIYCYETARQGVMSEKTQNNLLSFVEDHANNLKHFDVTWFGGEPTLAWDVIERLSKGFLKICSERNIEYQAFMITNASLIDEDLICGFKRYKIAKLQITLDGPENIHDARRVSRDGKKYFNTIISNINMLLKNGIKVAIRINMDKNTEPYLKDLLGFLAENLTNRDVTIYFGRLAAYTEVCRSIESTCYDSGEFAANLTAYYRMLNNFGFGKANPFPYPKIRLNACCAEQLNSYVIDDEGLIYKCWHNIGNREQAIGSINDARFEIKGTDNMQSVRRNPLDDPECAKCAVLPLCGGGCVIKDIKKDTSVICDSVKHNITDVMRMYYEYRKEGVR